MSRVYDWLDVCISCLLVGDLLGLWRGLMAIPVCSFARWFVATGCIEEIDSMMDVFFPICHDY